MDNFVWHMPTRYIFGKDQEKTVGNVCKSLGAHKVMIVFGGHSVKKSGLLERVEGYLKEAGLEYVEHGGVKPNPRVSHVREGIKIVREQNVDFLLAVGGGSVIDAAKAIGAGALYDGDVWDFYSGKANVEKVMPLGSILTIAAAGSEGSPHSVVNNEELGKKIGIYSEAFRPLFTIENPELTYSVPNYQKACGIFDTMMHTMERYFTSSPDVDLTDEFCEGILRTVIKFGPIALANPTDYNAHAQIMWASTSAHNNTCGVDRVKDNTCHRAQPPIGAKYDSAHGAGLATLCPAWMKYVYKYDLPRFVRFAVKVWGVYDDPMRPEWVALEGIKRLKDFCKSIGLPVTLEELGVKDEDIPELCQGINIGAIHKNGPEDIAKIYELAR